MIAAAATGPRPTRRAGWIFVATILAGAFIGGAPAIATAAPSVHLKPVGADLGHHGHRHWRPQAYAAPAAVSPSSTSTQGRRHEVVQLSSSSL